MAASTVKQLWRAYLRENVAITERFNQVYRGRAIRHHMQVFNARRRKTLAYPRGRAWLKAWRLSQVNGKVTAPRPKGRGFPLRGLQLAQSQTYASLDGL
jgi:hypothetical protein